MILSVVPLLVIVAIVVALSRGRRATSPAAPGTADTPAERSTVPAPAPVDPALAGALERAVGAGIVDQATADAILAHERTVAPPTGTAPAVPAAHAAPAGRPAGTTLLSPAIEAVAYVGACLVMIGMSVFVGQYWDELSSWMRPSILGAVAVIFFGVGTLASLDEPITWRFRNFVWLLSIGALAGCVGVLTVDLADWSGEPVAIAIGGVVAVAAFALWRLRDLPTMHLATFLGLQIALGGLLSLAGGVPAIGFGIMGMGVAWLALGRRDLVPPILVALPLGLVSLLIGPQVVGGRWERVGPIIGLVVAVALIAGGSLLHRFPVTAAGVIGLFVYLPTTVSRLFGDTVGPSAVLLVSGVMLLAVVAVLLKLRTDGAGHGRSGHGPSGAAV